MIGKITRARISFLLLAAALALSIAGTRGRAAAPQANPAAQTSKTAEQAFKNIQVLKDVPADQILPAMQFIATSLGVECEYCHVKNAFEKDDKDAKVTARKMMLMMFAANNQTFDGKREVTCYTCHRGSTDPVGTPVIPETEPKPITEVPETPAENLPKANQIIDKYVEALGGKNAIESVSSRVEKGTLVAGETKLPVEVLDKAPDKRITIVHMPNGDNSTAFDGHVGWLGAPGHPAHQMTAAEADNVRLDADLHFAADLTQLFHNFRVHGEEKIDGNDVYALYALNEGKPPVHLYFDAKSGLLVRMVRYIDTPLGRNPAQIDYADYRDAGGVKVPYRWTIARPSGRFTIQVDELKQNVPVDDAKFVMPPPPPAPPEGQKNP
ncbi:MAG TPA: c-type cytochrome [Candidatus Acidoferrales bacterium]|nr:c-type cytochrome [Candidatus Acidoferrales bacterium]